MGVRFRIVDSVSCTTQMNLNKWAIKWQIPLDAIVDMKAEMGLSGTVQLEDGRVLHTEAGAQSAIRVEAAAIGTVLWRNNNGGYQDDNGNFIRYGLANDSAAMNKRIKSSDLIGIRDGGQFICREVKQPGWRYTGTAREAAQLKFIELVLSKGGDAGFATGEGTL